MEKYTRIWLRPHRILVLLIFGVMIFGALPAQAVPITVEFTASDFESALVSDDPPTPAPTDPVSGTIVYEAASTTANIDSLTSIDLTIDGHSYSIGEVGFISPFGSKQLIGGTLNGVDIIGDGTYDFWLMWMQDSLIPYTFAYTSESSAATYWRVWDFSSFSVTESTPVPEPSTLLLLGSGLGLVAFGRKKFRK